jgi:mono/diheme cytochrome c family protein
MRLQQMQWARHVGVMFAASFIVVAVAAAGAEGGRPPVSFAAAPPDGAQLYRTYCASCHGVNGTGNGPAAVAMKVTPPDLTRIAARNNGMFPAERVRQIVTGKGPAAHGERNMPVWGDVFARKVTGPTPDALVDALVRHLDTLQQRTAE